MGCREIAHKNVLLWKLLHPLWFNKGRARLASPGKWKVQLSRDYGTSFYQVQALDVNGKGNWKKSLMPSRWDFKYDSFYIEPYGNSVEEICWKADLFDWIVSLEHGFKWISAKCLAFPQEREQRFIEFDLNWTENDLKFEDSMAELLEWHFNAVKLADISSHLSNI